MSSGRPTSPARPLALPATHSTPRIHQHNVNGLSDIASERNQRFARDIERKVVGPMPVNDFLTKFLGRRTRVPRFDEVTFSGVPEEPDKESAIYVPLASRVAPLSHLSHPHPEGRFKQGS